MVIHNHFADIGNMVSALFTTKGDEMNDLPKLITAIDRLKSLDVSERKILIENLVDTEIKRIEMNVKSEAIHVEAKSKKTEHDSSE